MKKFALFILSATLLSCQKNQPPECTITSPGNNQVYFIGDTINVSVDVNDPDGTVNEVRLYLDNDGLDLLEFPFQYQLETENMAIGDYTINVTAIDNEGLQAFDEKLVTIIANFSSVSTIPASEIKRNSATVGGKVSDDGGGPITETGIFLGTIPSPEINGTKISIPEPADSFSIVLTDLADTTKYYFKAYAENAAGVATGDEMYFSTPYVFPKSGLVADYPFNGTANDISGNNLHGIPYGPEIGTGRNGGESGSFSFDGLDDYILLPEEVAINTDYSFSIESWIFKDPTPSAGKYPDGIIFGQSDGPQGSDYPVIGLEIFPDATIRAVMRGTGNPIVEVWNENTIEYNQWEHLVMVSSGEDSELSLYLNGDLIGKSNLKLTGNTESNDNISIGAIFDDLQAYYHFYSGKIDMVRIWKIDLSQSEIRYLKNDNYLIE